MARKKSFSSELAHIYDSAIALAQEIKNYKETVSGLIDDAVKYQENKPLLNNLARVGVNAEKLAEKLPDSAEYSPADQPHADEPSAENPPATVTPATELPIMDGHHLEKSPTGKFNQVEELPATSPRNPRERHAHIKKNINIGVNI